MKNDFETRAARMARNAKGRADRVTSNEDRQPIDLVFVLPIRPKTKNQLKHAINSKTGRIMAFRDPAMSAWTKAAKDLIAKVKAALPRVLDEPLRLDAFFIYARPKSMKDPRPDMLWCDRDRDEDNMRKALKDAMHECWRDDSLVCCGTTAKCFAEKGGPDRIAARLRSASLFDPEQMARQLGIPTREDQ